MKQLKDCHSKGSCRAIYYIPTGIIEGNLYGIIQIQLHARLNSLPNQSAILGAIPHEELVAIKLEATVCQ